MKRLLKEVGKFLKNHGQLIAVGVLSVLLFIAVLQINESPPVSPNYEAASDSVVILIHDHGMTSGVLISEDGYILTCAHGGGAKFMYALRYYDDMDIPLIVKYEELALVFMHKELDIAIYKISAERIWTYSSFAEVIPEVGDEIFAIGTPVGRPYYISWGKLIDQKYDYDIGAGYLLHSASSNQGSSGGPLFNDRGEIVGINVAAYAVVYTMAGYVSLIDGTYAVQVIDILPAIKGIIETDQIFNRRREEYKVAKEHLRDLNRERPE